LESVTANPTAGVTANQDRRRGGNHDAVNTVRQKLNAFADALVKQVKILPDPFANPIRGGVWR
jgi:hypothetical protein